MPASIFWERSFYNSYNNIQTEMMDKVRGYTLEQLSNPDELADELLKEHGLVPPEITLPVDQLPKFNESEDGKAILFFVPIAGDYKMLKYQPSSYSPFQADALATKDEIILTYPKTGSRGDDLTVEAVVKQAQQHLTALRSNVKSLASDVRNANSRMRTEVRDEMVKRAQVLKEKDDWKGALKRMGYIEREQ